MSTNGAPWALIQGSPHGQPHYHSVDMADLPIMVMLDHLSDSSCTSSLRCCVHIMRIHPSGACSPNFCLHGWPIQSEPWLASRVFSWPSTACCQGSMCIFQTRVKGPAKALLKTMLGPWYSNWNSSWWGRDTRRTKESASEWCRDSGPLYIVLTFCEWVHHQLADSVGI